MTDVTTKLTPENDTGVFHLVDGDYANEHYAVAVEDGGDYAIGNHYFIVDLNSCQPRLMPVESVPDGYLGWFGHGEARCKQSISGYPNGMWPCQRTGAADTLLATVDDTYRIGQWDLTYRIKEALDVLDLYDRESGYAVTSVVGLLDFAEEVKRDNGA